MVCTFHKCWTTGIANLLPLDSFLSLSRLPMIPSQFDDTINMNSSIFCLVDRYFLDSSTVHLLNSFSNFFRLSIFDAWRSASSFFQALVSSCRLKSLLLFIMSQVQLSCQMLAMLFSIWEILCLLCLRKFLLALCSSPCLPYMHWAQRASLSVAQYKMIWLLCSQHLTVILEYSSLSDMISQNQFLLASFFRFALSHLLALSTARISRSMLLLSSASDTLDYWILGSTCPLNLDFLLVFIGFTGVLESWVVCERFFAQSAVNPCSLHSVSMRRNSGDFIWGFLNQQLCLGSRLIQVGLTMPQLLYLNPDTKCINNTRKIRFH